MTDTQIEELTTILLFAPIAMLFLAITLTGAWFAKRRAMEDDDPIILAVLTVLSGVATLVFSAVALEATSKLLPSLAVAYFGSGK